MSVKAKTTILCGNHRHKVVLMEDGTWQADCPDASDAARKLGALASLGGHIGENRGCVGLIALCSIGLPARMVTAGESATKGLGAWLPTYILYEGNAIVRRVVAECAEKRDEKHKDALAKARSALLSAPCMRSYWRGRDTDDEKPEELVRFMPDSDPYVGQIVAETPFSEWNVPLQRDWMMSVGKAFPVIDKKFVVGVSEHPGFVLALDRDDDDHGCIVIREFAVVDGKLGKVAA